jgi:hypothetical protein
MDRHGPGNGRKRFSLRDGTSAVINMKNRGNWKHRFGSKSRSSGNWSRADSTGRSIYTSEKLNGGRKRSSSFHFFWALPGTSKPSQQPKRSGPQDPAGVAPRVKQQATITLIYRVY